MGTSAPYSGSIAIVGGGISGLTLAISLIKRGFKVIVYEQARKFGEIGAGVAFHPAAQRAMKLCDQSIHDGFMAIATYNQNPAKKRVYFDFFDGQQKEPVTEKDLLFSAEVDGGFNAVHRAHFLDELIKSLPEGVSHFSKRLETLDGPDAAGRYTLHFSDGTSAVHDVVIGTDGIKSAVRAWLVGPDHPSAHPTYTHKYAYRGLIPIEKATQGLGADVAGNAKCYLGPDWHVLTFVVDHGKTMNVVAFKQDKNDWPDYKHLTRKSVKADVEKDFKGSGSTVQSIVEMLDPDLDCWAIFDTGSHPLHRYNKGKVLVLGDAGHATTPHHGSGAGMCIEDAAVLSELLADELVAKNGDKGIESAFEAYTAERIGRTRRLVESSRRMGDIYDNRTELGRDFEAVQKEVFWRSCYFWYGNVDQSVQDAKSWLRRILDMAK